jgi:hypothetical protein
MSSRELFVRKLIKEFNSRWGYELNISKIIFWNKDFAEYEESAVGRGRIRLNQNKSRKEMAEDLYHELGHAIIHQYGVKRKDLSQFRDTSPRISLARFSKLKHVEQIAPPKGYVSWYSQINGTEDFCEVLAAWAASDYKLKGVLKYDGHKFSLNKDKKLRRKVEIIRKILLRNEV